MLSMKKNDSDKCNQILESLGLAEFKDKHPMALSGGQKQRVAIASAIAASGSTVLVSTHDPELIELCCNHIIRIDDGKVTYQYAV